MQCKLFEFLQQTVGNSRRAAFISKELILLYFSRKGIKMPVATGSVNRALRSVLRYVQESEDSRAYE
jgi:hypothetical protein